MRKNQSTFHELNVDHRQVSPTNANQHTKFQQLPSSITFRVRGLKIKSGDYRSPQTAPSGQVLIFSSSTCKYLPVCQISTS